MRSSAAIHELAARRAEQATSRQVQFVRAGVPSLNLQNEIMLAPFPVSRNIRSFAIGLYALKKVPNQIGAVAQLYRSGIEPSYSVGLTCSVLAIVECHGFPRDFVSAALSNREGVAGYKSFADHVPSSARAK